MEKIKNENMKNNKPQTNIATKISIGLLFTVIFLFCFFLIFMLFWALLTSLKNYYDFGSWGHNVLGLPNLDESIRWNSRNEFFKLENYRKILSNFFVDVKSDYYVGNQLVAKAGRVGFAQMFLNTLLYCGLGAFCNVMVYTVTGFLCAKYKEFKFGAVIETAVIIFMAIPTVSSTPAEVKFLQSVGLYDTWLGHIFLSSNFYGVYALVFISTYRGLPDSYIEAAEIDGASQLRVLLTIAVPLQSKIITTVFLLNFISYWNVYESPLLYFPMHPTLAVGMHKLDRVSQGDLGTVTVKLASCMVLALPILIMFCFLHKKIMAKVSLGGIKE